MIEISINKINKNYGFNPVLKDFSMEVKSGERIALNTPIQGSSADILKKAMIEIDKRFEELGLKRKMLLQIHDELDFNVYYDELDIVKHEVKNIMENTIQLTVPLKVEINIGKNLYEAK